MADLPGGTVTFAFTDIEGSTSLLKRLGDEYADVLAGHRTLVRDAFGSFGGTEIDTQGDAFFYAFARARDAVAAATSAQRAHAEHAWPRDTTVRVRIGLHTGEPTLADGGYVGLDVVRAARLCGTCRGGQVLLSQATRALVGSSLPDGVDVFPLGERHLKDIDEPEVVYELDIAGVDVTPPPVAPDDRPAGGPPPGPAGPSSHPPPAPAGPSSHPPPAPAGPSGHPPPAPAGPSGHPPPAPTGPSGHPPPAPPPPTAGEQPWEEAFERRMEELATAHEVRIEREVLESLARSFAPKNKSKQKRSKPERKQAETTEPAQSDPTDREQSDPTDREQSDPTESVTAGDWSNLDALIAQATSLAGDYLARFTERSGPPEASRRQNDEPSGDDTDPTTS